METHTHKRHAYSNTHAHTHAHMHTHAVNKPLFCSHSRCYLALTGSAKTKEGPWIVCSDAHHRVSRDARRRTNTHTHTDTHTHTHAHTNTHTHTLTHTHTNTHTHTLTHTHTHSHTQGPWPWLTPVLSEQGQFLITRHSFRVCGEAGRR